MVAGKKLGKSHNRNKVRRRIREIARSIWVDILPGTDLVIVAKRPAAQSGFELLKDELIRLAEKGGLLKK